MPRSYVSRRNSVVYLSATGLQATGTLLLLPLAARYVGVVQMGEVYLAFSIALPAGIFLSVGIPASITRLYLIQTRASDARALATATGGLFLAGGAASVVAGYGWLSYVLAMSCFLAQGQCLLSLHRAENRPIGFAATVVATHLAPAGVATVLSMNSEEMTSSDFLMIITIVQFAGLSLISIHASRGPKTWKLPVREIVGFSAPLVPHTVALASFASLDKVVLVYLFGSEQVAYYQYGFLFGSAGIALANAMNNLYAPALYAQLKHDTSPPTAYSRVGTQQLKVALIAAGAVALLAPLAALMLLPRGYPAVTVTTVATVSALCVLPYAGYLYSIHSYLIQGNSRSLAITTPLAVLLGFGICIVLGKQFGPRGVAVGVLLGYGALAWLTRLASRRVPEVEWRQLRTTLIVIVVASCLSVLLSICPISLTTSVAIAGAYLSCAGLLLFKLERRASVKSMT